MKLTHICHFNTDLLKHTSKNLNARKNFMLRQITMGNEANLYKDCGWWSTREQICLMNFSYKFLWRCYYIFLSLKGLWRLTTNGKMTQCWRQLLPRLIQFPKLIFPSSPSAAKAWSRKSSRQDTFNSSRIIWMRIKLKTTLSPTWLLRFWTKSSKTRCA